MKNLLLFLKFASLIAIFMCNVVQAQLVKDGLVAYWSLDEDTIVGNKVKDLIGKNDGEIVGNAKKAPGKVNGALEFDGTSSVDITGTETLNFNGKGQITVSAWVKPASTDPVVGVVAGCCGTIVAQRDANGWALRYDGRNVNSEFEFIICPNWQGDNGFGAPKLSAGKWYYLTAVVNVNKMMLYVDGELVKEANYAGPITSNGPETEIGKAADGGFVGTIDEVTIYQKAISANDIKQNMQAKGMSITAVSRKEKLVETWGSIKRNF